jgi:ATP-dependent DNA ligase
MNFVEPMMALRVRDLPSGDWLCEMKFDGYRALAIKAGKDVRRTSTKIILNLSMP